jgi:glycerol-1-phosphatase
MVDQRIAVASGPSSAALAERFDAFLLDLDGVVFRGGQAVAGAESAVAGLRALAPVRFVTNNAARTPKQVAAHLQRLGVFAHADEVRTAAQAAVELLVATVGPGLGRPVLVVGGDGLVEALRPADFTPVWSADDAPVAVVQGFSPDLAWPALAEGCYALSTGIPWVAANLDPTLPTERGQAPGNGSFVAALEAATGRTPISAGKPQPAFLTRAVPPGCTRPVMVGDRLDTDIGAAVAASVPGALVLTGVTVALDVVTAPVSLRPTYVLAGLPDLLAPYTDPVLDVEGGTVAGCVGRWRVELTATQVTVRGDGPPVEALRGLAAAAWHAADHGHEPSPSVLAAGVEALPAQR